MESLAQPRPVDVRFYRVRFKLMGKENSHPHRIPTSLYTSFLFIEINALRQLYFLVLRHSSL